MTYSALTVQDLSMDMWHGYMIRTMRASTYDVTKGPKPSHQASAKYMKKSKAFVSQSVKRYSNMKKRWWFARSCPPPPSPHKHRQKLRIEWFCRYLEETPSIVACSGQTRLRKKGVITSCNTTKRYLVAHGVKLWRTTQKPLPSQKHLQKRRKFRTLLEQLDSFRWSFFLGIVFYQTRLVYSQ